NWAFDFNNLLAQPALMAGPLAPFRDEIRQSAWSEPDLIERGILLWRVVYSVALRYRRAHPDWEFLRHEDLSLHPQAEFGQLSARLGLQDTPRVRRTIEVHTSPDNPRDAGAGEVHKLRRDSRANVWSWRHRLSPAEIRRVRRGTEDVARFFYSDA